MIVDTSAVICILLEEPGWRTLVDLLSSEPEWRMSSASLLEVLIVMHGKRLDDQVEGTFDLLETFDVEIVPVTLDHVLLARTAYITYGRGFDSRARLNFGDCFSYALAKATGEPLLFIGDDFSYTDIIPALAP